MKDLTKEEREEAEELRRLTEEQRVWARKALPTGGGRQVPRKMTLEELDRWAR